MEPQNKNKSKLSSLLLLALLAIAALSIAGLAVYSLSNKKPINSSQNETTSTTTTAPSTNTFEFIDGSMKLSFKLPEQDAYGKRNLFLLDHSCPEPTETCVSLDFIEQQLAEWIIIHPDQSKLFPLDLDSRGLMLQLSPYRSTLAAEVGCDSLCGVSALISIQRTETELSLSEALEEINKAALTSETIESAIDPKTYVEEKLSMWETLVYKLKVPEYNAVAAEHRVYMARNEESLYYIDVYINSADAIPQVENVLKTLRFID